MEKRIDLHYTYGYKEDIDLNSRRTGDYNVYVEWHLPGQQSFGPNSEVLYWNIPKQEAIKKVEELQAEEMRRREQIEAQYPDIKQRADAAKHQAGVAKLGQLVAKKERLQRELGETEEAISQTEKFIASVGNPENLDK
jgi:hypothetical protein